MRRVAIQPPGTLYGQLQRGRGRGARSATSARGAGDLIYECVRNDPRWNRRIERRGLYYARLIVDLELPLHPIADHLLDPAADRTDPEARRTSLSIDVLGHLVLLSRRDAAEPLRRYVHDGGNWFEALDTLVGLGRPDLVAGLDELAAARCTDEDLLILVGHGSPVIEIWAARRPRIAEAVRVHRARRHAPYPPRRTRPGPGWHRDPKLPARSDTELLRLADETHLAAAVLELGRRRSPLLLDLAERLLPRPEHRCGRALFHALRELGPAAVPRARAWAARGGAPAEVGLRILARHGTAQDVPTLLAGLDRALHARDWPGAGAPAEGLGRLRARPAVPLLRAAWRLTDYSYLRPRLLAALQAIAPAAAEACAVEALWDCEDQVRGYAAGIAPLTGETTLRLRRLREDPAEHADVRAAAARRLGGGTAITGR